MVVPALLFLRRLTWDDGFGIGQVVRRVKRFRMGIGLQWIGGSGITEGSKKERLAVRERCKAANVVGAGVNGQPVDGVAVSSKVLD